MESLKASVAKHGLLQAIVRDEEGNILDGHQRLRACLATDTKPRYKTQRGLSEEEKWNLVFACNEHRRHMSAQKRREVAVTLRRRGFTQERIAELLGVDQKTVSRHLARAKDEGADLPDEIQTKAGKRYPTERKSAGRRGDEKRAPSEQEVVSAGEDVALFEVEELFRQEVFPELRFLFNLVGAACKRFEGSLSEDSAIDQELDEVIERLEHLMDSGDLVDLDADEFEALGVRAVRLARVLLWQGKSHRW